MPSWLMSVADLDRMVEVLQRDAGEVVAPVLVDGVIRLRPIEGADDLPVAWAFHKGGAEKPTVVTTRSPRRLANGISLPVRCEKPDGSALIEFSDVTAEAAR